MYVADSIRILCVDKFGLIYLFILFIYEGVYFI